MQGQKKRLTLDLDAAVQRRLKVLAALKGVSMRQYCQEAIQKEMDRDEHEEAHALPFGRQVVDRLAELRAQVFGGQVLEGDSAELIRQARAGRDAKR